MSKSIYIVIVLALIQWERHACNSSPLSESVETSTYKRYEDLEVELNCSSYVEEKEYILLDNGSLVLPGSNTTYSYETFFVQNKTAYVCADLLHESEMTSSAYDLSDEFLQCGHILIEPHEFAQLSNGSIFIEIYGTTYGSRDFYLVDKGVYVCMPQFSDMEIRRAKYTSKFSEAFSYVTLIGLVLSILSLLSHLAVFCAMSSVRNLPGCCLASLSLSLLGAYACFLTLPFVEKTEYCAGFGMCVYYFFVTAFFWMNAIAFDVWRSFRVVMRELRISSHRVPWRRFLLYSLYSWLVPALLTVLVKVADLTHFIPLEYQPSFGKPKCWFGQRKALLVFFAAPLCLVMALNAVFFLDVTYVISRATLKTGQPQDATLKKRFFMFLRLSLIMGLTWIVGLIAGYADNEVLWYLFVILNTLQGFFIFVVFSCSSKVRGLCFKKFKAHTKARANASVRTISQISGTV